jgi:hypothetical protein
MKAKKLVEQPPETKEVPAPDPEALEFDQFVSADPVHEAYESGQFCLKCGSPVKLAWKKCPICGNGQAVDASRRPAFKFKDAKAKFKTNPPPDTVTVTPVPKTETPPATAA